MRKCESVVIKMGNVWRSDGHCTAREQGRIEWRMELLSAVPSFDNEEGERLHESETEAKRASETGGRKGGWGWGWDE